MSILANVPELCDGFDVFGLCVSWLLGGLILGSIATWLWRLRKRLGERGRQLDVDQPQPFVAYGRPRRVSLVRLIPPPDGGRRGY